jgi:hypothetical protein
MKLNLISLIVGLIPGSLFVYRYSKNLELPMVIGLISMEILPYIVVTIVEEMPLARVFQGFLILYSLYEIGYLHNDFCAKSEKNGASFRAHITELNLIIFFLARSLALMAIFFALENCCVDQEVPIIISFFLLLVFFVHNVVKDRYFRVFTFLMLNIFKILLRLYVIGFEYITYICSSTPHIAIKLIHYLKTKKLVTGLSDNDLRSLSLPIYFSVMLTCLVFDYKYFLVSVPFFLNHNKYLIYSKLNSIIMKRFGG